MERAVPVGSSTRSDGANAASGDFGTTSSGSSTASGTVDDPNAATDTFRLLISARPAAIGDFDELTVSFDRARTFRTEKADIDEGAGTEMPASTATIAVSVSGEGSLLELSNEPAVAR